MVKLTANQQSFIEMMKISEEHARKGFELLASRPSPELFFDALEEQGLFSVDHHQGPIPADDPGYFRIPYWAALDYLKKVASICRENNDGELAAKVLGQVRTISRDSKERGIDNHHTWRVFAVILSQLSPFLSLDDFEYLPFWQDSKFDRGMLVHAIDRGLLKELLKEENPGNCEKICRILDCCTTIELAGEGHRKKPTTVSEGYHLEKMLTGHAAAIGALCGEGVARILRARLEEFFAVERSSPFTRPAVEEHPQNHRWEHSANALVESLRDVLIAWVEVDLQNAHTFVLEMFESSSDMVRRIGIYLVDQCWHLMGDIYGRFLKPELFVSLHIHELYNLLRNHFAAFPDDLKTETLNVLRNLPLSEHAEDPENSRKRSQRQWLSACIDIGYPPADDWYLELNADPKIGRLSSHPDFHVYSESFSGPGPSPFTEAELIVFAENGQLIEKLNGFEPNKRALTDALERAIQEKPDVFIRVFSKLSAAQRPYQYAVISGFKKLWDSSDKAIEVDWELIWQPLMVFCLGLLKSEDFWSEKAIEDEDMTPNRDWIPSLVAEFLQAGTRKDEHSYPAELLTMGWELVQILLDKSEVVTEPEEEAMTQAINSPKGKAIEALLNHALRVCRLADSETGGHAENWDEMVPVFDKELGNCKNGNYEFSTLAASYISNLEYLNADWLRANLNGIFPDDFPGNFNCALEGLTFAQATRSNYKLLVEAEIIDRALHRGYKGEHARERLIQRICLAYLWGDEDLQSPRFKWLMENNCLEDLKSASNFFWSVSKQELEENQKQKIVDFFSSCIAWIASLEELPRPFLSSLSRLSCYITTVAEHELEMLLTVAPHVAIEHNAIDYIEELDRLADSSPNEVSKILGRVLDEYSPLYDYDDHLKSLLVKLVDAGLTENVLGQAEKLRRTLPRLAEEIYLLTMKELI
nr:hypothetical protein [uncultured Desulfuromonas sp.]